MSVGMLVGGIFLGTVGSKVARNYFSTDDDTKSPVSDVMRKDGVAQRLMANPVLLTQYNDKYLQKKFSMNSAMQMGSEKLQVSRSRSLARSASSSVECQEHQAKLKKMTTPTERDSSVMGA